MKKIGEAKHRFFIILSVIMFFITVGIVLTVRMFSNYGTLVLQNTDNQLMSLARSVDRSVESHFARYIENLAHTIEHKECKEAEKSWLSEGAEGETRMRTFLENSLLGQDDTIIDILVRSDVQAIFSQSGKSDYKFLEEKELAEGVNIYPCVDSEGITYMALAMKSAEATEYAILIETTAFYEEITQNLSAELQNEIVMMDAGATALIHRQEDMAVVSYVNDFTEEDSKYSMLEFLLKQQSAEEEGADFCDAVSSATGRAYQARMAVVPATEETNGALAIGVSTDYDEMTRPMRSGAVKLVVYGGTVLLGMVSLLILLLHTFRGNERALREVALLKEKNTAMEELNRQTEELAHHQRLELMGTLTSGIAHEFNNLLAPIMGYSILVLEKLPPEETELYDEVLEIYNTSTKAKTVIARLQDLARKHEDGEQKMLVLDEVVQKNVEIASPAKPKTIDIHLDLNGEGQCILGNETQISQLMLNLLINAFHATEKEGSFVKVSTEVNMQANVEGEKVFILKVSDDGYGISEEVKKRIFEPFFTTKKGGQGTGLGLAIVQQVVEEYEGTICVESVEGVGTTFTVEFPIFLGES